MLPPGSKPRLHRLLCDLARTGDAEAAYHADAVAHATCPWGTLTGVDAIGGLWGALRSALPDMERRLEGDFGFRPRGAQWLTAWDLTD